MTVYAIPEPLAAAYLGAGDALALIDQGVIIDLVYFRSVIRGYEDGDAQQYVADIRLSGVIGAWREKGQICVGFCSCWEFTEL